jgi:hypothetical protein
MIVSKNNKIKIDFIILFDSAKLYLFFISLIVYIVIYF